ncbi:MAG: hypothetical protein QOF76_434, partial [Solirubrobacteraceae bacterium]|nr:hypothetical protein [Solirubrobacteraceae bacterium]
YSVKDDCRHPILQSDYFAAPFGHESGFAPDGNTFWIGGAQGIFAVDVSNPKDPYTVRAINIPSHGINLSADGNTLYETNPIDGGIALLDVSGVQARDASKPVTEISRLSWETTSIPQNSNPVTIDGKPYLLEFDEFAFRFNPFTDADLAGAARLIDISDPSHPTVTSNLRLQVNMPENHKVAAGDPTFVPGAQTTYGAHYCNVPRAVNPEIVACSFINSGLRIFDIRDPVHPREVAYYISPPQPAVGGGKSDAAFSQPAFDPARREVYYTDAASGFWNVRLTKAVWPHPLTTHAKRCRKRIAVRVRKPRRGHILKVKATVRGHRVHVRRKARRRYVVTVPRARRHQRSVRIRTVVRTNRGKRIVRARAYRVCR